jgi:prevent-host-death family protein
VVIIYDQSDERPEEGESMKKIGAAQFKAECLSLLDKLTVEGLIITKHGKPVARVVPYPRPSADLIGSLRGKLEIHGDILSTGLSWNVSAKS